MESGGAAPDPTGLHLVDMLLFFYYDKRKARRQNQLTV
jgi:hypothetical protein